MSGGNTHRHASAPLPSSSRHMFPDRGGWLGQRSLGIAGSALTRVRDIARVVSDLGGCGGCCPLQLPSGRCRRLPDMIGVSRGGRVASSQVSVPGVHLGEVIAMTSTAESGERKEVRHRTIAHTVGRSSPGDQRYGVQW